MAGEASIKHREMFDFFCSLKDSRSNKAVAEKFAISESQICRFRKREKWDDVIREREAELAAAVQRATILERVRLTKDMTDFGKELFLDLVKSYHDLKERKGDPFLRVNMAGNEFVDLDQFARFMKPLLPHIVSLEKPNEAEEVVRRVLLPTEDKGQL
jgi:hypothetical protein